MYAYNTYIFFYTKCLKNIKLSGKNSLHTFAECALSWYKIELLENTLASIRELGGRKVAEVSGVSHSVLSTGCVLCDGSWPTGLEGHGSRTYKVQTFTVKSGLKPFF